MTSPVASPSDRHIGSCVDQSPVICAVIRVSYSAVGSAVTMSGSAKAAPVTCSTALAYGSAFAAQSSGNRYGRPNTMPAATIAPSTTSIITKRRPVRARLRFAGLRCGVSTASGLMAAAAAARAADWSGWVAGGSVIGPGCEPGTIGVAPESMAATIVVSEAPDAGASTGTSSEM